MAASAALLGKSVLVTGSTSGIGWSIATQFAKAGARVMLQGLEKQDEVGHLISKLQGMASSPVSYSQADLSSEESCKHLIAHTTKTQKGLDILVNNAGIQFTSRTENYPTDKWDAVLKINLSAPFFLSRAALPGMYKNGWGRLVHIGSAHSLRGSANKSAYCAAKHGVSGMSKAIALEAAGSGVTSNTICPGWVLTPLVQKQIVSIAKEKGISEEEAKKNLLLEKHPTAEFVQPENLGAFAVFLCSDAAAQINGAALSMDVGWTTR